MTRPPWPVIVAGTFAWGIALAAAVAISVAEHFADRFLNGGNP